MGAPATISASATSSRSIGGRPPPPCSAGHVMPNQPRAPSWRENGREKPHIHESWVRPYRATASAATASASARSWSNRSSRAKSIGPATGRPSGREVGDDLAAQELSGGSSRQLDAELDDLRGLGAAEVEAAVLPQLVGGERRALGEHDHRGDLLAPLVVGD